MNKIRILNSLIHFIPAVLVLMILVELCILFFSNDKKIKKSLINDNIKSSKEYTESNIATGISRLSWYLGQYDTDVLKSTKIVVEFRGFIDQLLIEPGIINAVNYRKGIVLRSNNGRKNYILFREKEISKVSIYLGDRYGQEMSFNNLKEGDEVLILETI